MSEFVRDQLDHDSQEYREFFEECVTHDFDSVIDPRNGRRGVAPLSFFPESERERFFDLAQADRPPSQWRVGELTSIPSRAYYEWYAERGRDPESTRERNAMSSAIRKSVIERDGLLCGICGGDVETSEVHIDHIRPIARGGRTRLDNLQVAHAACNLRKGARA